MKLVVFDIDDTLTRTMDVDTDCFIQAVRDILEFDLVGMSWDDFPDVTDTAVLDVIYRRVTGTGPTPSDSVRFIDHFSGLLEAEYERNAGRFEAVPGSGDLLGHLRARDDWRVALATGAWRRTAEFKLARAGLFDAELPLATSDDHHTRAGIFETAVARSVGDGAPGFDRIVAVGDGSWDVVTARTLQVAFIGIGSESRLREIGAPVGVEDYRDLAGFYELLESAPVP